MNTANARLLTGKNKDPFAPIHFDGMYGLLYCKGTVTIPVSCGFDPSLIDIAAFIEGGSRVYRITRTWDVRQEGDDYVVPCYAEVEPAA